MLRKMIKENNIKKNNIIIKMEGDKIKSNNEDHMVMTRMTKITIK
jgi:hypothetical protein